MPYGKSNKSIQDAAFKMKGSPMQRNFGIKKASAIKALAPGQHPNVGRGSGSRAPGQHPNVGRGRGRNRPNRVTRSRRIGISSWL